MYYPYLYGKQKELIAVRTLRETLAAEACVQPVLEPVRSDPGTLRLTLEACERSGLTTWVVLNPHLMEFAGADASESLKWGMGALGKLKSRSSTRPVLMLSDRTTAQNLRTFREAFEGEQVGLVVLPSARDIGKALDLLKSVQIARVFFKGPHPPTDSVATVGKGRSVWVEDRFPLRPRNADYAGRHFFTDRHATFSKSGWAGFSDYTLLAPEPNDGGGPPGAVALHMSYFEKDSPGRPVHVEHFVSDRTDQKDVDTDAKFQEALTKFQRATRRTSTSFGLTTAAQDYLSRLAASNPPTLGTNKQLVVTHHLELMSGLMAGRY